MKKRDWQIYLKYGIIYLDFWKLNKQNRLEDTPIKGKIKINFEFWLIIKELNGLKKIN